MHGVTEMLRIEICHTIDICLPFPPIRFSRLYVAQQLRIKLPLCRWPFVPQKKMMNRWCEIKCFNQANLKVMLNLQNKNPQTLWITPTTFFSLQCLTLIFVCCHLWFRGFHDLRFQLNSSTDGTAWLDMVCSSTASGRTTSCTNCFNSNIDYPTCSKWIYFTYQQCSCW